MLYLLRLVHVISGALWVGGAIFIAAFLMPAIRAVGPAGGPVMYQLAQVRRLPLYMMTLMALTVLSGGTLLWRDSGDLGWRWLQTGPGLCYGVGAVLALVAAAVGMLVSTPTAKRLGAAVATVHAAGRPPTAEEVAHIQLLQAATARAATIISGLLVLTTAAMAVARYVP